MLAVAGIRVARAPSPAPTPAPGPAAEEPEQEDQSSTQPPAVQAEGDRLTELHGEFLGLERPPSTDPEKGPPPFPPQAVWEAFKQTDYKRAYLLALVPDPLDSTLANNFDFALDAVRRAFAAHGYLPDRADLPWLGEDAKRNRYRVRPGILLFRRTQEEDVVQDGEVVKADVRRLATVLLVGERPKTGIHRDAFHAAVEILERRGAGTPDWPLWILGPSFSGSAESLRMALREAGLPNARILTGTATSGGLPGILSPDAGVASFERAVLPDPVLQEEAWEFFEHTLGWNPSRIALLVEEDTAYGGAAAVASGDDPLLVRFPTGLTEVRKLWETSRQQRPDAKPATALPGVESASEVSLADPATPADLGTEFDPITTRTKELMIASLLEEVQRRGARYVGIVATDDRDKLYLTERVRGFAPGALLFTFENHLVQAHPRFVRPLRPVLLVGNFPTTIEYRREAKVIRQFGSEFHQGVYRAADRLVARLAGEHPAPDPERVWITVSGRGAILPIAALSPGPRNAGSEGAGWLRRAAQHILCEAALGKQECEPPPTTLASLGAAGYLLLALSIALLMALGVHLQTAVPPGENGNAKRLVALGAAGVWMPATALFLVAFYPGWLAEMWLQQPSWLVVALWWSVAMPFVSLTVLFLLVSKRLVVSAVDDARRRGRRGGPAAVGAAALTLGSLLVVVVVVGWLYQPRHADTRYVEFLHERVRHPMTGVSPLPPLVFLGLAAWTWARVETQRLRQRARYQVGWPLNRSSDPALVGSPALAERVARGTEELLPSSARFWGALALALLLPAAALLRAIQPIVEPRAYGWIFFTLAFAPFVLAAISFLRFFRIWRSLERLLDRLEQSPLCAAIAAAGKEADWKPMSSFSWRMPSFRLLVLSARKLQVAEAVSTVEITGEGTVALEPLIAEFFAAEQAGDLRRELTARRKLSKAFRAALERLDPETGGDAATAFVAIRLVAYLRYVFLHLRQSLLAALGTWLFLLLAVSSYAFEPKFWVNAGLWLALAIGSVVTVWMFVQMDRNAVLSGIAAGTPGRVDVRRPFVVNALTYGLAPLAAVVVSIFPELGRLGRWTDPLLRLLGN